MTVKKDYKTSKSGGGGMSGSGMGGGGLAGSGVNTTRTENIRTIVTISSYQNIGGINTGGGSLLGAGPTPPPPPPTPDPGTDDPSHQLPVGDAIWFMLVLAGGYVGWKRHRQFQGL